MTNSFNPPVTPFLVTFLARCGLPKARFNRAAVWMVFLLGLTGLPAHAFNRVIDIQAPDTAAAGASVSVSVTVSTDVGAGEQVGFFHGEFSVDGGATWTGFCYAEKQGHSATRSFTIPVGSVGSKSMVRVRAAFRGGKAGDVDFTGKPIAWDGSWKKWETPPAKIAAITIVK